MINGRITRRGFVRILAAGAVIASADGEDEAADTPNDPADFAFGVIADAQYCDAEPHGSRYYRSAPKKLAECVETLNQSELAFVIQLGDFIDRDARSYDVMTPIYTRIKAPRYHVLGNHDFSVAEDEVGRVPGILGMQGRYYSFRSNGWRFVVLDGNDLSLFARPKGSPQHDKALSLLSTLKARGAPNAHAWNGGVGRRQLDWLDQQLSQAGDNGERVVVFCHFPVYPEDPHNLWNDRDVIRVLDSHRCVTAFMNGHNHAGDYGRRNGIHYVTLPGMVETQNTTAYAVVHVHADSLRIAGYGRTPNRLLTIRP